MGATAASGRAPSGRSLVAATRSRPCGRSGGAVAGRGEGAGDRRPGISRIDDVVDFEDLSGIERLGVLVHLRGEFADALLAFTLVLDRFEISPHRKADRAFQPHRTESGVRPRRGQQRLVQAAERHRLCAQAVSAAQEDCDGGDGQRGAGDQHPAAVPDEGVPLGLGTDHVAGGVDQRDHRQAEGVAELHEPRGLVPCIARDHARLQLAVVGDDAHGSSFDPRERGDQLGREALAQHRDGVLVGDRANDRHDVVGTPGVLGHCATQR